MWETLGFELGRLPSDIARYVGLSDAAFGILLAVGLRNHLLAKWWAPDDNTNGGPIG